MTSFSSKWKYKKIAAVVPAELHVISRCYYAEDGKEKYKDLYRTCTAIVLLMKLYVRACLQGDRVTLASGLP